MADKAARDYEKLISKLAEENGVACTLYALSLHCFQKATSKGIVKNNEERLFWKILSASIEQVADKMGDEVR